MRIFKVEIKDGLKEALLAKQSVSFCSKITKCEPWIDFDPIDIDKFKLSKSAHKCLENNGLYRLDSILVSTGMNKNQDVFDPFETFSARATADHKPFNYMHDGKDIIGHSISHQLIDSNGELLSDDLAYDDLPDKFHIVENSVLYTFWEDPQDLNRMEQILAEIPEHKWFVSAEAAFSDFDYAMVSEDGEQTVVSRNAETAFLTKYLKVYGGSGVYDNYRVGRILRNFVFAGKGLVTRPANPESVILNDSELFKPSKSTLISFNTETNTMNEAELKAKISSLETQLNEVNKVNAELLTSKNAEKVNLLTAELDEAKKELASKSASVDALNTEVKTLKDQLSANAALVDELKAEVANVTKAKEASEEDMKKMKKEQKAKCRYAALVDAGKNDEDANALVAKFDVLDDDQFNDFVKIIKSSVKPEGDIDEDPADSVAKAGVLDDAKPEDNTNLNAGVELSKNAEQEIINTIVGKLKPNRKSNSETV